MHKLLLQVVNGCLIFVRSTTRGIVLTVVVAFSTMRTSSGGSASMMVMIFSTSFSCFFPSIIFFAIGGTVFVSGTLSVVVVGMSASGGVASVVVGSLSF